MGTDVYLEWHGKGKEEFPVEAWASINAGGVGYLRASIWMGRENAVLRMLFPDDYWTMATKVPYDFKGNFSRLHAIGLRYLVCTAVGQPLEFEDDGRVVLDQQAVVTGTILNAVGESVPGGKVETGTVDKLRDAVTWLHSLYSFFELGLSKQGEGLEPYLFISW